MSRALDAAGWKVRGVDRVPGPRTTVVGDLRDGQVRRAAVRSADVVIHAAALHAPHAPATSTTKLAAERLVTGSALASVVLRIARCFPEPLPVLATHLRYRAVRPADVATATVSAAAHDTVAGTFNVAGRYSFTRADCVALLEDAATVIAARAPKVAAAFHDRGWPLPRSIDRVYDSSAAADAFGYRPAEGVLRALQRGSAG